MNEVLAIFFPSLMLFVVTAGYLLTVFEPYYALRTAEGLELLEYHSQDPKLQLVAEYWAYKLTPNARADGEPDGAVVAIAVAIHQALVRHRFLSGDDPRKLHCRPRLCRILARAQRQVGFALPGRVAMPDMVITPKAVTTADGNTIWRGEPAEYRSRFCDFYPEP